jgi:hypothetical protein
MANIALITNNVLSDSGTAITSLVSGSGTTNYLPKFTGSTALGNSIIYDNGTAVGIGTTSPASKLHVSGGSDYNALFSSDSGRSGLAITQPGTSTVRGSALVLSSDNSFRLGTASYYHVVMNTDGSTQVLDTSGNSTIKFTAAGNVGINTVSPGGKLDVNTAGSSGWDRFVVTNTAYWGDGSTQYITIGAGGASGIMLYNPHIVWNTGNSAAAIRLGRSGGVSTGAWYEIGTGASDSFFISKNGGVSSSQFYISSAGNVLIGTTTDAGYKFQVNGITSTDQLRYTRAIDVSSTDLNSLTVGGFYNGQTLTNAPTSGWYYITVEAYSGSSSWIKQTVTTFGAGNTANLTYTRVNVGGTWSSWKSLLSIATGGTSGQFVMGDGSLLTGNSSTGIVRYGDYITGPTFPGKSITLNPSVVKELLWGGQNIRFTVTDSYTGTYPNAGSTWVRTYELIDGTSSVYSNGTVYCGFWVNYPPANMTVRVQNTSGTWYGPYSGADISVSGQFQFWKVACGGPNYIKAWEITFTPTAGYSVNLQTVNIVIDNSEGIDQSPLVSRAGSSIYGTLSFIGTSSATKAYINNSGVIGGLVLKVADTSGIIEFQNSSGTKAGSMFMDGSIWRLKSSGAYDAINIFGNGNIGVKQTTDAGYTLDVLGTIRANNTGYGQSTVRIETNNAADMCTQIVFMQNSPNWPSYIGTHVSGGGANYGLQFKSQSSVVNMVMNRDGSNYFGGTFALASARVHIKGAGSTSSTSSLLIENSSATELFRVRDDGNIGVGAASPANKLQISNSDSSNQLLRLSIAYDTSRSLRGGINWNDTSGTTGQISTEYDGSMVSMVFGSLYNVGYNTNSLMIIRGNGNVGIGTTSPTAKLTVVGGGTGIALIGDAGFTGNDYTGISLNNTLSQSSYNFLSAPNDKTLYINRPSGYYINFREANGTNQMVIATGGNVLIGTSIDGGYKLSVNGSGNFNLGNSGYVRLQSGSGQRHGYIQSAYSNFLFSNNIYYDGSNWRYDQNGYGAQIQTETLSSGVIAFNTFASGTAGNVATIIESMRIVNNGNILMGTTTDSGYKLDVNGTSRFTNSISLTGSNRYIASGSSSQSVALYGGSAYSDGAYFNITGNTYGASPGGGSAEFVIRTNSDSKFAMFGYNGSSWLRYMTLFGPTGNLNIGYATSDLGYKLSIQGDTYNTGQIVSVGNISSYASVLVNGNSEGYDLMVYPDTTSGPNNLYSGGQVKANIYTSSVGTTTIVPSTTQVLMSWYPSTTQAVFIDYVIWIDGPDAMRSGTFTIVNDAAGNVQYNDVSTIDLNASTSSVVLNVANNGGTMEFTAYNSGGNIVYMNIITRYIPTML